MPYGIVQQPAGSGSSMTIEELGPAGPGLRPRSVVLVGSALPHQGAEWAFENNVVTTWYPGNGVEATQQVLGPRELPSAWEGEWRRTLLGRHPVLYRDGSGAEQKIISPMLVREVLEAIARAGVRLRVTWAVRGREAVGSTQSPIRGVVSRNPDGTVRRDASIELDTRSVDAKIVREGRIKSFRTPIDRHTDVHWAIEFAWYGRGGKQDRTEAAREDASADKAAAALEASVNATVERTQVAIYSAHRDVRKSATHFTLGQLENLADAPSRLTTQLTRQLQQNVSDFRRVGAVAKKLTGQPAAIQNAMVDFARNTTTAANAFADLLGRRPAELNTRKQKVASLLRANNTFNAVAVAAALNARRGQELEAAQRGLIVSGGNRGELTVRESATVRAGQIVAIHVCKAGETPQSLSGRYYGNPDQGAAILRANRLPLHQPTFRRGALLVIPALASMRAISA